MKVLHVLCDLSGGGAERLVLDLCRYSSFDAEVAVIHEGGALAEAFEAAGVNVRCTGRVRGRPGGRALGRLARWAREVDVVHTHLWAGDFWGRPAAALARRPVVTTEHNTQADSPRRQRIWLAMAPLSQTIVCVSRSAAGMVADAGVSPARLTVIENGIDLSRFQVVPPARSGRLLAVGRLTRQKGFDVLLKALRAHPVPTTILGEGEDRAMLEQLAEGLPVTMSGWTDDIRPHLAAADALLIPSRWEGFGLVAVEAMASGVPVIASRVDGLVEVVGDAGILVPPEDPVALAAAIQGLLSDPDRQAELRQKGIDRAPEFSIQRTVDRYAALYERVISSG